MTRRSLVLALVCPLVATGCVQPTFNGPAIHQPKPVVAVLSAWETSTIEPVAGQCVLGVGAKPVQVNRKQLFDGRVVVQYDRNQDTQVDYVELYETYGVGRRQVRPFPYRYLVSDYFDSKVDRVFIDTAGNGRCEDIKQIDVTQGPEKIA